VLAENPTARQFSVLSTLEGMAQSAVLTATGASRLRECVSSEGALRLMPGDFGTDGFFVALLETRD
jgi:16S rRNA C967 or C1407 C5-methylase (RsmB/RsmF family)